MIEVTLINGNHIVLNSDLIEFIEATPDTVITLSSGKKMIVSDSVDDVVSKIMESRRSVGITVKGLNFENKQPER